MNFLTSEQVLEKKKPEERVTFLIRHAERRHILPTDEDYGSKVPLTETGESQALAAGKEISRFKASSFFFGASPVFRCRQTAALVAKACDAEPFSSVEKVVAFDCLAEFYVSECVDYERHLRAGFYPAICRYLQEGTLAGFLPVREGSEKLLAFLLENSRADLNLFCSHDAWIVPFLAHFTGLRFSSQCWMNFSSGATVLLDSSKKNVRIFPVKFLGDGFLRF